MNLEPICRCDENGNPILSEREKMMEATAEEITQLLRERNLTVGEARSLLEYAESTICQISEEIPVGITAKEISEMQANCKYAERSRRRTKRLLAAMSKCRRGRESKNQGFQLRFRP